MAIFTAAKQPEREIDHSIQSSAEIKNDWILTSTLSHGFITRTLTLPHKNDYKVTTTVFCSVTVSNYSLSF